MKTSRINSLCFFCNQHVETMEQRLNWSCPFAQSFWKNIFDWIGTGGLSLQSHNFSMPACLGLVQTSDHILINRAPLVARHDIYVCKTRGTVHIFYLQKELNTKLLFKRVKCLISARNWRSLIFNFIHEKSYFWHLKIDILPA